MYKIRLRMMPVAVIGAHNRRPETQMLGNCLERLIVALGGMISSQMKKRHGNSQGAERSTSAPRLASTQIPTHVLKSFYLLLLLFKTTLLSASPLRRGADPRRPLPWHLLCDAVGRGGLPAPLQQLHHGRRLPAPQIQRCAPDPGLI